MSSLLELFQQYLKHGKYLKGWSDKTPVVYQRAFASFQMALAQGNARAGSESEPYAPSDSLNKQQLEAWVVWMRSAEACGSPHKRNLSPACVNIYIRSLNSFCSWLKDEGHLAEKLKLKQLPAPLKPVTVFSDADIKAIVAFKPQKFWELRTWTLIQVLLDTGCRIDEILSLTVDKIDFDNQLIHVRGKGNKERKVPFSIEGRRMMFRFQQTMAKRVKYQTYLFCTRDGQKLRHRNIYRDVILFCTRLGITKRVHPHLTRHTFACHFMKNGGSIYTLSRILGHSSVSTTQTYIRGLGVEDFQEEHARVSPLSRLR